MENEENTPVEEALDTSVSEESHEETHEEQKPAEDHNWKRAREVMSTQAREIQELKSTLEYLKQQKEEVEEAYDPDDYATYQSVDKRVDKKTRDLNKKIETLEQQLQQTAQERLENNTRSKYEDYDLVIEKFAIPMLEKDKSLANTLKASSNPFDLAYRLAKTSPEYEKAMKKTSENKEKKIQKNMNRPLSANADGGSLRDQANQLFKDKREVWRKAQEYASKV